MPGSHREVFKMSTETETIKDFAASRPGIIFGAEVGGMVVVTPMTTNLDRTRFPFTGVDTFGSHDLFGAEERCVGVPDEGRFNRQDEPSDWTHRCSEHRKYQWPDIRIVVPFSIGMKNIVRCHSTRCSRRALVNFRSIHWAYSIDTSC